MSFLDPWGTKLSFTSSKKEGWADWERFIDTLLQHENPRSVVKDMEVSLPRCAVNVVLAQHLVGTAIDRLHDVKLHAGFYTPSPIKKVNDQITVFQARTEKLHEKLRKCYIVLMKTPHWYLYSTEMFVSYILEDMMRSLCGDLYYVAQRISKMYPTLFKELVQSIRTKSDWNVVCEDSSSILYIHPALPHPDDHIICSKPASRSWADVAGSVDWEVKVMNRFCQKKTVTKPEVKSVVPDVASNKNTSRPGGSTLQISWCERSSHNKPKQKACERKRK